MVYSPAAVARSAVTIAEPFSQTLLRLTADAKSGQAQAQYNLALLYEEGLGVPADLKQAVTLYLSAAEQEHVRAQYKLGLIYLNTHTDLQDTDQAIFWLRRAARQNDANAFYQLGLLFSDPSRPQYYEMLALEYLLVAARQGHLLSQLKLGELYQTSQHNADLMKAYIWLSVVQHRGDKRVAGSLQPLADKLTVQELSIARQAISEIYNAVYQPQEQQMQRLNPELLELSRSVDLVSTWMTQHGWPISETEFPAIIRVSKADLVRRALEIERRKGGRADEITVLAAYQRYADVPLQALYDEFSRQVVMSDGWDFNSVEGQAELVHELVHHLQSERGDVERIACTATLEKQAMGMQNRYLMSHGIPVLFSDTDIALMGDCDE